MTNEEMLLKIFEGQEEIHKLLYDMEKRLDRMEINIDEIESKVKITRNAVNYIGDISKQALSKQ